MLKSGSTAVALLAIVMAGSAKSSEQVLYSFPEQSYPVGNLTETGAGTFFSTTYDLSRSGTAFRLKQKSDGWSVKTVHAFDGGDGANPLAGLTYDKAARTLYGVTA